MKRLISAGVVLLLLFGMAGCSNLPFLQSSGGTQSGGSQAQSSSAAQTEASSSAASSSEDASSVPESSNPSVSSAAPAADTQARQEALQQTKAAISTRVPLVLPADVPAGEGKYLAATTVSQTWHYEADFFTTSQPAAVNSKEASQGTPLAAVKGTEYRDLASAKDGVDGYQQVNLSVEKDALVDLGHGIKAVADAGCGHGYLNWNEGRWYLTMNSPNDPEYSNKTYPDSKKLAQQIVAYLDSHMLPVPQKIGMVDIDNWNNNMGTTITWQDNQMVYQVTSRDPMIALQVAVEMKSK